MKTSGHYSLFCIVATAIFFIIPIASFAADVPPTPFARYLGDADGDLVISGLDAIQHQNVVASKPFVYTTLQPPGLDTVWNTCDLDGDRACTGLDLIITANIIASQPVSRSDNPWAIGNAQAIGLPAFMLPGTSASFSVNLYSNSGGRSGRPGIPIVANIVSGGGSLGGRDCDPDPLGGRDQSALPASTCALAVTQTDWTAATDKGLTEAGTYGFSFTAPNTTQTVEILFFANADPALDIPEASIRLLVNVVNYLPFQPSVFSADDEWVYYLRPNGAWIGLFFPFTDVWRIKRDGTGAQMIVDGATDNIYSTTAYLSAYGSPLLANQIEYSGCCFSNRWTVIADADGSNQQLLSAVGDVWLFTISPDGNNLLTGGDDSGLSAIIETDLQSQVSNVLTSGVNDAYYSAAYSPDGSKIAFTFADNWGDPTSIAVMNANGSLRTTIKNLTSSSVIPHLSRSVTNDWIYFSDYAGDNQTDIFRINWDGSVTQNLTNTVDISEANPIVRPDQAKILYSSYDLIDGFGFWEMNLDGSSKQELVGFNGVQAYQPHYSHDGNTIVYEMGPSYEADIGIFERGISTGAVKLTEDHIATDEHGLGNMWSIAADIPIRRSEAYHNLKAIADKQFAFHALTGWFVDDPYVMGWLPLGANRYSYTFGSSGGIGASYPPDSWIWAFPVNCFAATQTYFCAQATGNIDSDDSVDVIQVIYDNGVLYYYIAQNDRNL